MKLLRKIFDCIALVIPKDSMIACVNFCLIKYLLFLRKNNKVHKGPITVAGYLSSTIGLGKSVRILISALQEEYEVNAFDFTSLSLNSKLATNFSSRPKPGEGGLLLVVCNPSSFIAVLLFIGSKILQGKKIILIPFWELEQIPDSWIPPCVLVDEIWASSEFIKAAFSRSLKNKKIRMIPTPLELSHTMPDLAITRKNKIFSVLNISDLLSGISRKNILGIIDAFQKAFGESKKVELILKISGHKKYHKEFQQIIDRTKNHSNIKVVTDYYTDEEMLSLFVQSDAIISLHRAEGYGLLMAEGMLYGKPVIATGWSGNMSFMNKDCALLVKYKKVNVIDENGFFSSDQLWAEPDIDQAAEYLRLLFENPKLRKKIGDVGQKHVQELFSVKYFLKHIEKLVAPYALKVYNPASTND